MGIARRSWLLLIAACSCVCAAEVERFIVSQAHPQLPVMTGYLDIVDANRQPVSGLTPADFSASLGGNSLRIAGIEPFVQTGEGVGYVFLVDVSKSISPVQFGEMKGAIRTWIAGMKPPDRAAICTFGEGFQPVVDFTEDKQKLTAGLNGLEQRDLHTRLYQAIDRAAELEQRVDSGLPARRGIVVLSDGKDEGSALTPEDVLLKLRANHLPVYSIGYSHLPRAQKSRYLDVLHRFSNASGGYYQEAGRESIQQLYAAMQQAILRVFAARLSCSGCPADGRSYPLEITLTQAGRAFKAGMDVVPLPATLPPVPPAPKPLWTRLWVWLAALAVIAAVLGAIRWKRKEDSISTDGSIVIKPDRHEEGPPRNGSDTEPVSETGLPIKLTIVAGEDAGSARELKLIDKAVIGRGGDCDIVVADPEVSNRHCELALIQGQVLVYDLGSMNSTYVNGVPIQGRHKLEPLDTILVGDTELRVYFEEK